MVFGALGCVNNADLEKELVNDNIVLDVFIICQKLYMKKNIDLYMARNTVNLYGISYRGLLNYHSARR